MLEFAKAYKWGAEIEILLSNEFKSQCSKIAVKMCWQIIGIL